MKSAFSSLLILLFSATGALAQTYWENDSRAPYFCMQNFNAYGPIYASNVVTRTEYIVGFLKGIPKCDIVHFQEVWNSSHIQKIERSLSQQYSISAPNKEATIGLMSLSMGDISGRQTVEFNVNKDGSFMDTARGMLKVKKAYHVMRSKFYAIDEELYFMNTHLHQASQAVRLTQILDLLQWRLQNQDAKLILSGDFNAGIQSLERQALMLMLGTHDAMEESLNGYPEGYCTYCAKNPLGWLSKDQVFDYIFFSNTGKSATTLRPEGGEVNMKGYARSPWSDHYGVRVNFFVEPTTSQIANSDQRREKALKVLAQVQAVFLLQSTTEFKPYLILASDLAQQLADRRGSFNDYFESYR